MRKREKRGLVVKVFSGDEVMSGVKQSSEAQSTLCRRIDDSQYSNPFCLVNVASLYCMLTMVVATLRQCQADLVGRRCHGRRCEGTMERDRQRPRPA